MIRTVVAFPNVSALDAISGMLEKNGITVRYRCRTGAEAIRAAKKMGGGVVICAYKFPDMTADQLSYEIHDFAVLLVIAKPVLLDMCEAEDIYKIAAPIQSHELVGSVNMLLQFDQRRYKNTVPERSGEENEIIHQAKLLLMSRNSMTEDQAHKFLQHRSMETSSKMVNTARLVIESLT